MPRSGVLMGWEDNHRQQMEEVVAKALGVKKQKRKGEKSHPANIGSNIITPAFAYKNQTPAL